MQFEHFLGHEICDTATGVDKIFGMTVEGVNEIIISDPSKEYPYLTVLLNGEKAYAVCVTDGESAGFQAYEKDVGNNGTTIFYVNTPTEELEISNSYLISKEKAKQIVLDFMNTFNMSSSVEWEEL